MSQLARSVPWLATATFEPKGTTMVRDNTVRTLLALLALVLVATACGGDTPDDEPAAAPADAADEPAEDPYFAGRTIELAVGEAPGGGTDTIVRTIARHLANHIPGEPTIVVRNMPGAGGLVAQNFAANAEPDGTVWNGSLGGGNVYATIDGDPEVDFALEELTWIGNAWGEDRAVWARTAAFPDAESLISGEVVPRFGAPSATHTTAVHAKGVASVLGIEIQVITGYDGTAPIMLDIEREALDGRVSSWSSVVTSHEHWAEDDFIRPLMVVGSAGSPALPDVPPLTDFVPAGNEHLVTALLGPVDLARSFVGPPGIPDDVRDVMRDAYADMVEDPAFLSELEGLGFFLDYRTGETLEQTAVDLFDDEEILEAVRGFMAD